MRWFFTIQKKKFFMLELRLEHPSDDKFFSVFKADYDTNSTSLNYFKSIFHKISDFCTEKWICQEKLLDLSDNLGKIMNQAAEILHQISFTLVQSQKKENKLFDDLQCLQNIDG